MSKIKNIASKVLAVALAFVLLLGTVPNAVLETAVALDSVTVTVTDKKGNPVPDATVSFDADGVPTTATTDDAGVAALGTYTDGMLITATVTKTGYKAVTLTDEAVPADTKNISVQMEAEVITDVTIEGKTLTYTGAAQEAVSVTKVDGDVVTYEINGVAAEKAEVTDAKVYQIKVTVARTGYEPLVKMVETTVTPAEISDITLSATTGLKYNGSEQALVSASGIQDTDTVAWTVNGETVTIAKGEVPKGSAVGTYTVGLTVDRGSNYKKYEVSVDAKIELGELDLTGLAITPNDRTYDGTAAEAVTVSGKGDYTLEYKMEESAAWGEEMPQLTDAGSYTVYVRAVKDGYDEKNFETFPVVVTIAQAEQTASFQNYSGAVGTVEVDETLPYAGVEYDFAALVTEGNTAANAVTYSVVCSKPGIATIDTVGKLAVTEPGTITVTAVVAENQNYKEYTITYALTVKDVMVKGEYISFANTSAAYVLSPDNSVVSNQTASKCADVIDGSITYSSTATAQQGLAFDPATGALTVANLDTLEKAVAAAGGELVITVTATKAASGAYAADEAAYEVKIGALAAPADPYTLDPAAPNGTNDWYTQAVVVTPKEGYAISKTVNGTFESSVTFDDQGDAARYVYLKEIATNKVTAAVAVNIKIDTVAPAADKMTITYSEANLIGKIGELLGFYNPTVTITFTAVDETSGIEAINWKYNRAEDASQSNLEQTNGTLVVADVDGVPTATLTLPGNTEQLRGKITFSAVDKAGNESAQKTDEYVFVVDTVNPEVKVTYTGLEGVNMATDTETQDYYDGGVKVTLTVTEANFYADDVAVSVTKDGANYDFGTVAWGETSAQDVTEGIFTLTEDGDYVVSVAYKDKANNDADAYTSHIITVDQIAPVVTVSHSEEDMQTIVTVTEHNFFADRIGINLTVEKLRKKLADISAEDAAAVVAAVEAVLRNSARWTNEGDVYTCVIEAAEYVGAVGNQLNGKYTLIVQYTDPAGHAVSSPEAAYPIDFDPPYDLSIAYNAPVAKTEGAAGEPALWFYGGSEDNRTMPVVTFTAFDTSAVAKMNWAFTADSKYPAANVLKTANEYSGKDVTAPVITKDSADATKFTAVLNLPVDAEDQLRGYISLNATDNRGNTPKDVLADANNIIIIDTKAPVLVSGAHAAAAEVKYTPVTIENVTRHFYDGDVIFTVVIQEANFFAEDVVVKVTKDGNETTLDKAAIVWTSEGDEHTGTFTLSGDGDYGVAVTYTDRSGNKMDDYTYEEVITIDTTAPEISVAYDATEPFYTAEDGREYYNVSKTVTITVKEHNFDAHLAKDTTNPVYLDFEALDVNGSLITLAGIDAGVWEKVEDKEDTYVMNIKYVGDANYIFDLTYSDIAGNAAVYGENKAEDYEEDLITVDKTKTENVAVSYSDPVTDDTENVVKYYGDRAEVTIIAADAIAGVHSFYYIYELAEAVSKVNADMDAYQMIGADSITYGEEDKGTATATFWLPAELVADKQFNGGIKFYSVDRAGNTTEVSPFVAQERVVVDDIKPTVKVEYSKPVNEVDNVSYYDGKMDVTVTITEANFFAEDVVVSVTRNAEPYAYGAVVWGETKEDVTVGTFTVNEDGHYVITVAYTDRSGNVMETYTSNQRTIDTVIGEPTYSINGVSVGTSGGAYKGDATISFYFSDVNYDTNNIRLVKTRFNSVEDVTSRYISVAYNAEGGSGSFSIPAEVLDDGVYVLTIGMTDKALHSTESYVKFSINRYGSVYEYDDYLVSLIKDGGQYITVQNGADAAITEDLIVTEYNADQILEDSLKILITRDGEPIEAKYTTNPSAIDSSVPVGASGWYQYVYTISADNFAEDGVYKITLSSAYEATDSDSNESTSVPANSIDADGNEILDSMTFTVDTTAPAIRNIVNLEEAIVNAQSLEVRYTIVDVGGMKSIDVFVNDRIVDKITDFGDNPFHYMGAFTINESTDAQTVRIKVTDLAGNVTDTAAEDFSTGNLYMFNDVVTVSTNLFVRWYANKPLFWGTTGGGAATAGAAYLILAGKRKKKEEK